MARSVESIAHHGIGGRCPGARALWLDGGTTPSPHAALCNALLLDVMVQARLGARQAPWETGWSRDTFFQPRCCLLRPSPLSWPPWLPDNMFRRSRDTSANSAPRPGGVWMNVARRTAALCRGLNTYASPQTGSAADVDSWEQRASMHAGSACLLRCDRLQPLTNDGVHHTRPDRINWEGGPTNAH